MRLRRPSIDPRRCLSRPLTDPIDLFDVPSPVQSANTSAARLFTVSPPPTQQAAPTAGNRDTALSCCLSESISMPLRRGLPIRDKGSLGVRDVLFSCWTQRLTFIEGVADEFNDVGRIHLRPVPPNSRCARVLRVSRRSRGSRNQRQVLVVAAALVAPVISGAWSALQEDLVRGDVLADVDEAEVLRVGCVGTSAIGRPRPVSVQ